MHTKNIGQQGLEPQEQLRKPPVISAEERRARLLNPDAELQAQKAAVRSKLQGIADEEKRTSIATGAQFYSSLPVEVDEVPSSVPIQSDAKSPRARDVVVPVTRTSQFINLPLATSDNLCPKSSRLLPTLCTYCRLLLLLST